MKKISDMSEAEAKALLNSICDQFGLEEAARTEIVISQSIANSVRRSNCLSKIEAFHTVKIEDDEEEELLNWGENPDKYLETYTKVIDDITAVDCRNSL